MTRLLAQVSSGQAGARAALFDVLYAELRRLAGAVMRRERPDHTLQPTALVHEAYIRLMGPGGAFENRAHFLAVAATAMRRVLVDHARARQTDKRGGSSARLDVEDLDSLAREDVEPEIDLLALDDALTRLDALDPRQGRIVELRFFGGLTVEETAEVVGISERTVKREWQISRAWLSRELKRASGAADAGVRS